MGLFSGITKSLFGSGGESASKDAVNTLKNLKTPAIEDMQIELEGLVQQGIITPEEAQAALVDASAFEGISLDPNLKEAQMGALAGLQEIGQGGMTAIDRASLNQIQQEEQAQARGARDAITQNANARGAGGSGLELASQLINQQGAATRASNRGFDVAAQAQARALEAIMQRGELAGNIRGQDMDEQSRIAQAKDQIAQFNAQNKQQMNLTNTAARNNAQAQNLSEKQRVADTNVGNRNQQEMYNKNLVQEDFDNRYRKAGGTEQAQNNLAKQQDDSRNKYAQLTGTIIQSGAALFSDKNLKENVEEFNPSSFLDEITGYKYNYKDPKFGDGPQVGVMAQDLEKGAPQAVEETPEGKVIDYNKMGGPMLAALSDIHERLKRIEGA